MKTKEIKSWLFGSFVVLVLGGVIMGCTTSSDSGKDSRRESSKGSNATSSFRLRVATYNVGLYGNTKDGEENRLGRLNLALKDGKNKRAKKIARIIQTVRPDILLINEFDYEESYETLKEFLKNYLEKGQGASKGIHYEYFYAGSCNTGVDSGEDLNGDGKKGTEQDAFGFGFYPGQYGMVVLSRYPISKDNIRTFQKFLWKDMPNNNIPPGYYSLRAQEIFRLSSKSHWDIPIEVGGKTLHILASHPTPPVFDGDEDRNGRRNYDEIRFWADYISDKSYIYDDEKRYGGFNSSDGFIILGDQNASPNEGDAFDPDGEGKNHQNAINQLLKHELVAEFTPISEGAVENDPENKFSPSHTAKWKMRADYLVPSKRGFNVIDGGVFWPTIEQDKHSLMSNSDGVDEASDHRLVWMDIDLK